MALYNDLRRPIAEDKEFNKHYSLTSRLVRLKTNLAQLIEWEQSLRDLAEHLHEDMDRK